MKIIIIGATSGIGRSVAQLYAKDGHQVGITGRRENLLEEIRELYPNNICTQIMDVTASESIDQLKVLINQMQGMDLLLYSSGIGKVNMSMDYAIENATNEVNVTGFTRIINFGYHYFKHQGHGHISAISSIAGFRGLVGAPSYSSSKAYQRIYLESLAQTANNEKLPLKFTTIIPGFVDTDLLSDPYPMTIPLEKAARVLYKGLTRKKRIVYVTKRWKYIGLLMKMIPVCIWEKLKLK